MRRSKGVYLGDPFDFVAASVIAEDVGYIIPAAGIPGEQSVMLHPGRREASTGHTKRLGNCSKAELE